MPTCLLIDGLAAGADHEVVAACTRLAEATGRPTPISLAVVLKLAKERSLGLASFYTPYIASLPASVPTLLHTPLDEVELAAVTKSLEATPMGGHFSSMRNQIVASCSAVAECVSAPWLTVDTLLWAHCMFTSRAMSVPLPLGAFGKVCHLPAMVPLADICNHRRGALSSFHFTGKLGVGLAAIPRCVDVRSADHVHMLDSVAALPQGGVAACATTPPSVMGIGAGSHSSSSLTGAARTKVPLRCARSGAVGGGEGALPRSSVGGSITLSLQTTCAANSQVCINYGDKTNSELLLYYGFVLPVESRCSVHVTASGLASSVSPAPLRCLAFTAWNGPDAPDSFTLLSSELSHSFLSHIAATSISTPAAIASSRSDVTSDGSSIDKGSIEMWCASIQQLADSIPAPEVRADAACGDFSPIAVLVSAYKQSLRDLCAMQIQLLHELLAAPPDVI